MHSLSLKAFSLIFTDKNCAEEKTIAKKNTKTTPVDLEILPLFLNFSSLVPLCSLLSS
jgi:hypothetical protein